MKEFIFNEIITGFQKDGSKIFFKEIFKKILFHLTDRNSGDSTGDNVEDFPLADKCEEDPDSLDI